MRLPLVLLLLPAVCGATDLDVLKARVTVAPYASMSDADTAAALNVTTTHVWSNYWITDHDLYATLGTDDAEQFLALMTTLADTTKTKLYGTEPAAGRMLKWLTGPNCNGGLNIGAKGVRDWFVRLETSAPSLKPSVDKVLGMANYTTSVAADLGIGYDVITTADVTAARALP